MRMALKSENLKSESQIAKVEPEDFKSLSDKNISMLRRMMLDAFMRKQQPQSEGTVCLAWGNGRISSPMKPCYLWYSHCWFQITPCLNVAVVYYQTTLTINQVIFNKRYCWVDKTFFSSTIRLDEKHRFKVRHFCIFGGAVPGGLVDMLNLHIYIYGWFNGD